MGGFGALSYAGRHPGLFRAAASYSGVVATLHTPGATDFVLGLVQGYVPDPLALWGDPTGQASIWAAHNPVDLARALRHTPLYLSSGNGQTGPLDQPGGKHERAGNPAGVGESASRGPVARRRRPAPGDPLLRPRNTQLALLATRTPPFTPHVARRIALISLDLPVASGGLVR
nr:alpha/beta hydrolase-fold protein [Actinopolymorpha pittospori]